MAGGKWTAADVASANQRSGFYINFIADAVAGMVGAEKGVVALPITAGWGPSKQIVEITKQADLEAFFSSDSTLGNANFLIKQSLKNANKVLAYRLDNGGAAATITVDLKVIVNAKYTGSYGNFSLTVEADPVSGKNLKVNKGSTLLQTINFDGTAADMVAKINASGSSYLGTATLSSAGTVNDGTTTMAGGTDGIAGIVAQDFTNCMAAFETQVAKWNVFHAYTSDSAIQDSIISWIKKLRGQGTYIQAVLGCALPANDAASKTTAFNSALTRALAINYEGIIYNYIMPYIDSVARSGAEYGARIAGLIAGYGPDYSLTYAILEDVTSLYHELTSDQIKSANGKGVLTAFSDGEYYLIEKGINSLTVFSATQHVGWSKIKNISVMDYYGNSVTKSANKNYIGKVLNDEAGQDALLGAIKDFNDKMVKGRYLKKGVTVGLHPDYASVGDQVFLQILNFIPVDSMDEMYVDIYVGR